MANKQYGLCSHFAFPPVKSMKPKWDCKEKQSNLIWRFEKELLENFNFSKNVGFIKWTFTIKKNYNNFKYSFIPLNVMVRGKV